MASLRTPDDQTQFDSLQSVKVAVLYLVLQERFEWGNKRSRYDVRSLVTTIELARKVAEEWRGHGAKFVIEQVPALILGTKSDQIGLIEINTTTPFAGWDVGGAQALKIGCPVEDVIQALGPSGTWRPRRAPNEDSIVYRVVDRMDQAAPLMPGSSFKSYTSSFTGSKQRINWDHGKCDYSPRGAFRIVAEFERENSPEVVPLSWTEEGLRTVGFEGFTPFGSLPHMDVPTGPGVYAILMRPEPVVPEFLPVSSAGWFKGKDPTVPVDRVTGNWVAGSDVVYIGKADGGAGGRRGLRKRLDEFRRHGAGEPVGHWGGRMIWQLADRESLLVCWLPCDGTAEAVESRLLNAFEETFDSLPFANLKRGLR